MAAPARRSTRRLLLLLALLPGLLLVVAAVPPGNDAVPGSTPPGGTSPGDSARVDSLPPAHSRGVGQEWSDTRVGFSAKAITPVGEPPDEWKPYFTPQPQTGVWGEPFEDLNGDGCMSGITNDDLGPVLDGEPPREGPEPHVDQPWNSAGDTRQTGVYSVRGVTIVGDPGSTGKWDGLWANAGFGSTCAEGVHDDTWARAVVIEQGDTTVAMVSLDVVGLFNNEVVRARDELARRYPDLPIDELVVSSTHTHEGVDTMGYWGQLALGIDGKFPAYQAFIRSQIIDAVHDAYRTREPARIKLAQTDHTLGIRDSRPPDVIDPVLLAAQFLRKDGTTIGTIVNWSNHPEAQGSDNPLISSDFPHGTRETLEERLGGTAVYFSGSVGGLMTPLRVDIPGYGTEASWERTFEIGRQVALAAEDALAGAEQQRIGALDARRRTFYVQSDNNALRALNANGVFDIPTWIGGESWGPEENHREALYAHQEGDQIETEMVLVTLGPAMFLTVPGELSPELELGGYGRPECPEADTGRPYEPPIVDQYEHTYQFVLGLGQDELGYIIPGYDFHIFSAPEDVHDDLHLHDHDDGTGTVPVGGEQVRTCGEGHYEETVSISSVFAPWVTCVAAELAGRDPWDEVVYPACAYDNMHLEPYGFDTD